MPLFQNPFQDGHGGTKVLYIILGVVIAAVVGGIIIQISQIDSGRGAIVELILMLLGGCSVFLVVEGLQSRSNHVVSKSIAHAKKLEHTWAVVGYIILFGLLVTIVGVILQFVVPDWRPLLIAAGGMLFVIIALWYGQNLEQR